MTPSRRSLARVGHALATLAGGSELATTADVEALNKKLHRLTKLVEKVASAQKLDAKWRIVFRRQLTAMIRHLYLEDGDVPHPNSLSGKRFRLRSQNEEDGITLALLKLAGVRNRRFVEIGCGGTGGNSAVLAYEFGWSGLMLDASRKAVAVAQRLFRSNLGVNIVREIVTSENVNELLVKHGMVGEIDFMSIDIDSHEYWVFEALQACSPRLVVIEYNAGFGAERALTIPNGPRPENAPKQYQGASLAALEKLARTKGYRLILCEEAGVNAFFLRHEVAPSIPGLTAAQAFRSMADRPPEDACRLAQEKGLPLVAV